jgi:hypothetical protein
MNSTAATPLAPPMLDWTGIAAVLGTTRKHARSLIDHGQIYPAFNLTTGKRRFIRAYRLGVENFAAGRDFRVTFDDMISAVFTGKAEAVPGARVYGWLNVSIDALYHFIEQGHISASSWRRGPANSARVNCASLISFLRSRLVPVT